MTLRPSFNMRLRQYTPLGAPGSVIPDMGLTIVSGPDGSTLNATFSSVIYQSLPDDVEVAVEVWANASSTWTEGRDSRFVLLTQDADDRDRTGTITVTGVGLLQWMASKAALAGVTPYSDAGNVEAACTSTTVSVSGKTFTWSGHVLGEGDRVRITDSGKAKGLSSGSVYFVRNPSGSTFQVSHTATGAIKSYGSSHTIHAERVRTRIVNLNGHKFSKNMAISVWDANGQNLTNGSQYYVVNPTASTIQVADKPGGIPREFAVGDALTVYRYLDGARLFKNQTPGQIIGDCFLEARDRGWGQDASGNDQVFHSWTNAGDSNSLLWPARVDDPSITGVSIGFQPGTPLWDQVRFMVDNGWAEFASHARTLDLFAPLTGADYTTAGNVRRIGDAAQSVKVSKDLTDYRTTEVVRGDGPVEQRVSKPRSPWGVLEVYTTAAGVGSAKHAKSYGNTDLGKYSAPQVGYTVTEAAQEAAYLPILDYQRGDWVQVRLGSSWKRLRVTQWTFAKATTGEVTVTVLLEAKKRHLLHKVAHASRKANGGRVVTTTTTTPRESDARKGAKPSTLTVTTRTTTARDKSARGTVQASWLPVTTDEDGNDLTGAAYEVVVRVDGEQYGKTVAVTKHTTVDLPAHSAGTVLAVSVRTQSDTGAWGEATDEVEYVVALPEDSVPLSPTAPVVASTLGSITVTWDGNLTDPIDGAIPADPSIAYVAAQRSADSGSTWVTVSQTLAQAGTLTDLGLAVGTAYQYRLVATSQTGGVSAPSPVASCSVVAVNTAQINADFTAQVTTAASNASAAQTAASNAQTTANSAATTASNAQTAANAASTAASNASSAAQAAQTAANSAQTSANGKNTNHYSTAGPSGTGVAGDEWFQTDASGNVLAQWVWTVTNGTGAWTASLLTGAVLTSLDAGKITTGTLSAARIAAGTISASQLAIADFANLFENPRFDTDTPGGWGQSIRGIITNPNARLESPVSGASVMLAIRGNGGTSGNTDVAAAALVPVILGDQLFSQFGLTSNSLTGGGAVRVQVRWVGVDKASTVSWNAFHADVLQSNLPTGSITTLAGSVTAPSGAAYAQLYVSLVGGNAATNTVYCTALLLRRKADATLIVDGTITATQIAASTITSAQIAANTITAGQIAANTITAGQIAASTITTGQIAANTIQAGDIAANTITAAQLSATAIDTMTLTGATIRTASTAKTSGGVQIDSTGLHGYNASGAATFTLSTAGALTVTGANVTGTITATSGTISGTLTIGGSGKITSTGASSNTMTINNGQVQIQDGNLDTATLQYNGLALFYNTVSGFFGADSTGQVQVTGNADVAVAATGNALTLTGTQASYTSSTGKLVLSADSSGGYVQSPNTRSRQMTAASGWAGGGAANGGTAVGSTTAFVTVDSNGTFGRLDGSPRFPSAYSDVITTRALNVGSTGQLGTASSARRTKNLHEQQEWDDETLDRWVGIPTWTFDYKADDKHAEQWGVVAEEVLEAGFKSLIYFDETLEDPESKIDGFAYERMAVFNRLALTRIYARLQEAESRLAILDGKA